MRLSKLLLVGVAAAGGRRRRGAGSAADPIGKGLVMYMQMGGNAGDGATLARQTGAEEAAEALGVELKEQFSAWAPGDHDQPVQGSDGGQAGLHRDHGPSRQRRVP